MKNSLILFLIALNIATSLHSMKANFIQIKKKFKSISCNEIEKNSKQPSNDTQSKSFSNLEEVINDECTISNQCAFPIKIYCGKKKHIDINPYTFTKVPQNFFKKKAKITLCININQTNQIKIPKDIIKKTKNTHWIFTPFLDESFLNVSAILLSFGNGTPRLVIGNENNPNHFSTKKLIDPMNFIKFNSDIGFNQSPLNIKKIIKTINFFQNSFCNKMKSEKENFTIFNQTPLDIAFCFRTYNKDSYQTLSTHPFNKQIFFNSLFTDYRTKYLGLKISEKTFFSESIDFINTVKESTIIIPIFNPYIQYLVGLIILPSDPNSKNNAIFMYIDSNETDILAQSIIHKANFIHHENIDNIYDKNNSYAVGLTEFAYDEK